MRFRSRLSWISLTATKSSLSAWLGLGLLIGAGSGCRQDVPSQVDASSAAVERWVDYYDDSEAARIVAALRVRVEAHVGQGGFLEVEPRALGTNVSPMRGFGGVAGVNVRTARELGELLEEGDIELVARPRSGGAQAPDGSITSGPRHPLPMRRLGPDGRLDFNAVTSDSPPEHLTLRTSDLSDGPWTAEVVARGDVRLAVDFDLEDGSARLLEIRGHQPPLPTSTTELP